MVFRPQYRDPCPAQNLKATPSPSSLSDPDQSKDFLIDDDYKDQPELTFCCQEDEEGGHSIEAGLNLLNMQTATCFVLSCKYFIKIYLRTNGCISVRLLHMCSKMCMYIFQACFFFFSKLLSTAPKMGTGYFLFISNE
jgi:hypothetical protein